MLEHATKGAQQASGGRVIAPLMFWHGARLEQLPPATMLADPDAAARALIGAARLYGVDLLPAVPLEFLAWAVRASAQPGTPLVVVQEQQLAGQLAAEPGDPELVAESAAVAHAAAIVQRLVMLVPNGTRVALPIPTPVTLASQLGGHLSPAGLDPIIAAFLRTLGPAEPAAVIRIGEGERSGTTESICAFFGIELLDADEFDGDEVSAPPGDSFAETAKTLRGRVVTTRTEIPADADPSTIAEAIQMMRRGGESIA